MAKGHTNNALLDEMEKFAKDVRRTIENLDELSPNEKNRVPSLHTGEMPRIWEATYGSGG